MRKIFAIALFLAILFVSGCIQQKPYVDTNPVVVNPLMTSANVPKEMQYLSKGESGEGPYKLKATFNSAHSLGNYSYFDTDANEEYFFEPKEDFIFVVINATIENSNDQEESILTGANDFSLVDKEGYRFYPKVYYSDKAILMIEALEQKAKFKGDMLFEIPKSKTNMLLQYLFAPNYSWQINVKNLTSQ